MATIYAPIWKDIFYTGDTESLTYSVLVDGEEIYKGRAYIAPDTNILRINVSKICQDYLSASLPDFRSITSATLTDANSYRSFELVDGEGTLINTYNFLYCWDYLTNFSGSNISLARPINGHYCPNMKVFSTEWSNGTVKTTIAQGSGDYCGSGALYYLNKSGGWDSFLIEGVSKRTDAYDKYTYNKSFDNNTIEFEEGVYISQIQARWTLHTGFLSDEESKRLAYNLIPSNKVYFHNFEDDTIVPVVITNSSVDYKTYRNEGRKMVRYDITLNESQKKINR